MNYSQCTHPEPAKPRLLVWLVCFLALLSTTGSLPALTLDPVTRVHSANNQADSSGSISVLPKLGEENWTAKVVAATAGDDVSWVTALPVPPSFLAYSISENFNAESRKALIVFSPNATFTLVQNGRGGTLNPSLLTFGRAGGTATVDITVLAGTKWRFENTNAWITFTSPVNNLNSGTRSLTVAANPGLDPRTGILMVAGQTLTIKQTGDDVLLSTDRLTVPYYFNLASVAVSAASSTAWKPESNVPWITFSSSSPVQGPGQFSCLIAPNDAFNERSGTVTVGSKTVIVRQIGNQRPLLQIDPTHSTAVAAGASGNFNVTVSPGTPWSVVSQSPWLRVDNSAVRTNSGTVGVTALPNNTTQARVGYLNVVRSIPVLPAEVDPLLAFPKSMPVLAHLTRADSGVDEIARTSVWNQVLVLGPRSVSYVKMSLPQMWMDAYNSARSESDQQLTLMSYDTVSTFKGDAWVSEVLGNGNIQYRVFPKAFGGSLPLVNKVGVQLPNDIEWGSTTLDVVRAKGSFRGRANNGSYQPGQDAFLPAYVMWSWPRTNLNQRLIKTKGMNFSGGISMVVLAEASRDHAFGFDDQELVVPRSETAGNGAQRLLVASVAASGAVSVFADGNPVQAGITAKSPGMLRTSFHPGYRCTVYGSEIGQQSAAELTDYLNPTRVYEVRQDPFQISVVPQQVEASATASTVAVNVTVAPGVSWTASSPVSWVLIDGTAKVTRLSPGTLNLSIAGNNSTESRSADLVVAEQTVKVSQRGRDVNLTGLSEGFAKTDGLLHGTVSPLGGVVMVGIEPENGAQWVIHAEAAALAWAKPTQMDGIGTKSVLIAIAPYSSSDSSRTAVFQIGSRTLILTQRNFEAALDPSQQTVGNEGGVFEARLSVPGSALWNAVSLTPWISITTSQQASGSGSFFYRVDSGTGSERFGYLSVGGELFKVVQTANAAEPQPVVVRLQGLSGAKLNLGLLAPMAATIVVEESSDLISWLPVQSVTGRGAEVVPLSLPYETTAKARFYRGRR